MDTEKEIRQLKAKVDVLMESNRLLSKAVKLCSLATLAMVITVLIKVVLD